MSSESDEEADVYLWRNTDTTQEDLGIFINEFCCICPSIDKISSLSCQKVACSITFSKMGNNVARQASVILRNIPEYIRRYPSAYCTR